MTKLELDGYGYRSTRALKPACPIKDTVKVCSDPSAIDKRPGITVIVK
jgi:hypothetical protein